MPLSPKNWASFQHYKDRAPPWIKLHRGLLDNLDYHLLTPIAGKCLPLIWLIASEKDGLLPSAGELAFRLRMGPVEIEEILAELEVRQFLVITDDVRHAEQDATPAQLVAESNGFGSRHISDAVKRAAWDRDGGKCRACGSSDNIEYDHIHPVSKGGNSELENIQLLCRPCNRSKRVRSATPAQQSACDSRSLEERERDKKRKETDSGAIAPRAQADAKIPKKASKPLPSNYPIPDRVSSYASSLGLSSSEIAREHTKFCNHAKQTDRRCVDWAPAEDTWMIGAAERLGKSPPSSSSGTVDWEVVLQVYKRTGHWSKWAGNDPSSPSCQAPRDLLEKYGIPLPSSSTIEVPGLRTMQ